MLSDGVATLEFFEHLYSSEAGKTSPRRPRAPSRNGCATARKLP